MGFVKSIFVFSLLFFIEPVDFRKLPVITQATIQLVEKLFPAAEKEDVLLLLVNECGGNLPLVDVGSPLIERIRLAAIKVSNGDKTKLCEAIEQAKNDWRDLLVWAEQRN